MATYQAFVGGTDNTALGDLDALVNGSVVAHTNGISVTFGNDPNLGSHVTVTLEDLSGGNSITGTSPLHSWNITDIVVKDGSRTLYTISGITGVDGDVTNIDKHSIFQAETFHNAPRLIFHGHANTIIGGPANEFLASFGSENGPSETVIAGTGTEVIRADGGINSLFAGSGHDFFLFNTLDENNPTADMSTVYHYSAAKDKIFLNATTFNGLTGTPTLLATEFHLFHNVGGKAQIVYNPHTGAVFFDFFSSHLGHEVREEFAVLDTTGPHHPHHPSMSAADFFLT